MTSVLRQKRRLRVVAYCRVSTNKKDQANSFETQKRFFESAIRRNPEWELVEIYADEGISGTSTKHRDEFNRMVQDGFDGKFDLVITKSVSRLARNTIDCLTFARELKLRGVYIHFLVDNLNTEDDDYEKRLSDKASAAQEGSHSTSINVSFGLEESMNKGVIFGSHFFGYDRIDKYNIVVNEEEAETVRFIFDRYLRRRRTSEDCKTIDGERP